MQLAGIRIGDIVQSKEGEYVVVEAPASAESRAVCGYVIGRPLQRRTLKSRQIAVRWSRRAS